MKNEDIRIDYKRVFAGLPTIMGMPMIRVKDRWWASRKMDGTLSPRQDKLVCRMVDDGIQIFEQGFGSRTLFNWMIEFGGCKDRKEAHAKLVSLGAGFMPEKIEPEKKLPLRHVDPYHMKQSAIKRSRSNDNLTLFLKTVFDPGRVESVLRMYNVGAEGVPEKWMTQFWYVDESGIILHDKKMMYKPNGHRDRDIIPARRFKVGSGYHGRCLFGAHLLPTLGRTEPVYLVESEKTAIICSLHYGRGLWLASGGMENIRVGQIGEGWKLLPDYDGYEKWNNKYKGRCVKWWESYPGYECGPKDDIGDLIINYLRKK
jgi:hypothetical protein